MAFELSMVFGADSDTACRAFNSGPIDQIRVVVIGQVGCFSSRCMPPHQTLHECYFLCGCCSSQSEEVPHGKFMLACDHLRAA